MTSSDGAPPGVQGPTTGGRVTAEQGWNALTHALSRQAPAALFRSARARAALRALTKAKR